MSEACPQMFGVENQVRILGREKESNPRVERAAASGLGCDAKIRT